MQVDMVRQIIRQFALEFICDPYICYTEHGIHARFYTLLYNSLPADQRYSSWQGKKICVVQKEYPTAANLGKPQRQHWDIAVIKTPPASLLDGFPLSYDYLKLAAVVEFGMNEAGEHLLDDIARLSHESANVEHGFIVHLYRLSTPGARISGRDWSANSARIISNRKVASLTLGKSIEIVLGVYDATGRYTNGVWLIQNGKIVEVEP